MERGQNALMVQMVATGNLKKSESHAGDFLPFTFL